MSQRGSARSLTITISKRDSNYWRVRRLQGSRDGGAGLGAKRPCQLIKSFQTFHEWVIISLFLKF